MITTISHSFHSTPSCNTCALFVVNIWMNIEQRRRPTFNDSSTSLWRSRHYCANYLWSSATCSGHRGAFGGEETISTHLRFVGICFFVFSNSCCISKSTMRRMQKLDWKLDLPWFSYDSRKCMCCGFLNWIHTVRDTCYYNWQTQFWAAKFQAGNK